MPNKLQAYLRCVLRPARAQGRAPNIDEIVGSRVPYLDATIEEVLRCAGTAHVVDREAVTNTDILGCKGPQGIVLTCLVTGPDMMSPGFAIDETGRSKNSEAAQDESRIRAWNARDMSAFKAERWIVEHGPLAINYSDAKYVEMDGDFDTTAGPQLAFGLGPRGCYGRRLVYAEMSIILTLVAWNFELLPCSKTLSRYKSVLITTNELRQ